MLAIVPAATQTTYHDARGLLFYSLPLDNVPSTQQSLVYLLKCVHEGEDSAAPSLHFRDGSRGRSHVALQPLQLSILFVSGWFYTNLYGVSHVLIG